MEFGYFYNERGDYTFYLKQNDETENILIFYNKNELIVKGLCITLNALMNK